MGGTARDHQQVLTLREAARYLRLSESTTLRLANRGLIAGAKVGRQWRFTREAIQSLVRHPEILRRVELRG